MAEGDAWLTAAQIEASLDPLLPENDPDGIFGVGLVVDCVSRAGVLAMPADVPLGLNLLGSPGASRRRAEDDSRGNPGAWEFAPSAVRLIRSYLGAHPEVSAAVLRSAHRSSDDDGEGVGGFRVSRFLRGLSSDAARGAVEWRRANLSPETLAADIASEREPKKKTARGANAAKTNAPDGDRLADATSAKTKAKDRPPARPAVLVPAEPPAVPAWGGAVTAKRAPQGDASPSPAGPNLSDILREEETRASRKSSGDASPTPVKVLTRRAPGSQEPTRAGARAQEPTRALARATPSDARAGGWADMLRGGPASGSGDGASSGTRSSGSGWAMRSVTTVPAPPKLPKITPERLAAEARRSKIDQFGKIKCLVCGRMFKAYRPLEQHLVASHYGLNSMEAKAIEAAMLAAGQAVPGDGSAKTNKPERVAVQFGQILEQPRSRPGDAPIANLASSLSAYIREAKPSKREKRAAAGAGGRPKVGGELMVNPNQASSSAMVNRRGKEHEGGKKKKRPTKLKRIILKERLERKESEERDKAAANAADDGGKEIEVTVEVGRVYVNLLVSEDAVGVDLLYLEDEDEGEEEDAAAEKDAAGEEEVSKIAAARAEEEVPKIAAVEEGPTEPEPEPEPEPEEISEPEEVPEEASEEVPEVPSAPAWGGLGFKEVLLRSRAEEEAAMHAAKGSSSTDAKATKAPKPPRSGPKVKGVIRTCDVCGVSCSGDDAWASHLAGKNHAKAVKRRAAAEAGDDDEGGSAAVPSAAAASKNKITFVGEDAEIRYADQVISKELNASVVECVGELKRFQDRAYFKDPVKAKMRRRLVFGLREVAKAVQLKRAKAVVVAPNIERIESEGGLDDVVSSIIADAKQNGIPLVFALTRNKLGQIVGKRMRISAVAVLDHNGADDQFKAMLQAAAAGREAFRDKKEREEREAAERDAAEREAAEREAAAEEKAGKGAVNVPRLNPSAATFVPKSSKA